MVMEKLKGLLSGKKSGRIEKQWEFKTDSQLLHSPSIGKDGSDGKKVIVFGTQDGKVYSLDDTSKVKWFYDIKEKRSEVELLFLDETAVKSIRCPPLLADINNDGKEEVIFGSDNGSVYALSESGTLLWQYNIKTPVRSSAVAADIDGDKKLEILFGGNDSRLYALDNKGKLMWSFKASSPIESVPAFLKGKVKQIVFGTNNGTIYSVDPEGKELWNYKTQGKITAQPLAADLKGENRLIILCGSHDNNLYALDEAGHLIWKFATEGSIYSRVSLADINNDRKLEIIFGSCDNRVYAINADGHKIWSYETDFWVVASPIVADIDNDGKLEVVAGSYDNSLYVLDAEGTFILNYMPGISGIAQQPGHYSGVITSQPGQFQGKKIWEYKTDSFIVGSAYFEGRDGKKIVVGTKKGNLNLLAHQKER